MSRNERLAEAIHRARMTPPSLAASLGVDPKTVDRWVTQGRIPYRRHRQETTVLLDAPEAWLWPETSDSEVSEAAHSELIKIYAHRYQIPNELWLKLFRAATASVDILVYAGLFLPEQTPAVCELLVRKAQDGARVRLLFGDPECDAVRVRGDEEGIDEAVATKIRNALHHYRSLAKTDVDVRLHRTTLYTSIYRSDDEMIASPHVLGLPGAQAPALHLRRTNTSNLFDTYSDCVERVWAAARPAWTEG